MLTSDAFKQRASAAQRPGMEVWLEVEGHKRAVFVTIEAITKCLGLRPGGSLMVEECSDFVTAHRRAIARAASRKLRASTKYQAQIVLLPGDL